MERHPDVGQEVMMTRRTALAVLNLFEDQAYDRGLTPAVRRFAETLVTKFKIGKRYYSIWPEPDSQP
jgi:hypothetical protein